MLFAFHQCPAGTFSVGGGTRLEDFATWPLEWDVETYCAKQGEFTTYLDCGWTVGEVRGISSSPPRLFPSIKLLTLIHRIRTLSIQVTSTTR